MQIEVDPRELGYHEGWDKNIPRGRKVRIAETTHMPPDANVIYRDGVIGSKPPCIVGLLSLYFLPEDHPIEVYGKRLEELPPPPEGLELCGDTLTHERPHGATHVLLTNFNGDPMWEQVIHSWTNPRLWARPKKKRYLKVMVSDGDSVTILRGAHVEPIYDLGVPLNGAEIVEE